MAKKTGLGKKGPKGQTVGDYKILAKPKRTPIHIKLKKSEKASDVISRSKSKTLKNFMRGDTNKQLNSQIIRQENKKPSTWVEGPNGRMIPVDLKRLKKKKSYN